MSTRIAGALSCALVLAAACGETASESAWTGTITDSAGVPVIQNPEAGLWAPGEAWVPEEVLSIGSMEGELAYQFGQIIGVDVDARGNVYIADSQAREIRVFGPQGAYLRTLGRPGSGPGELGVALAGVFVVGDEVWVPDLGNQRVNRYAPEGEALGSIRLDLTKGVPVRWDRTADNRLVAQLRAIPLSDSAAAPTGDPVVAMDEEGNLADTVAMLPAGQSLQVRGGQARVRIFEPEPLWDVDDLGGIISGKNDALRIEVRGADAMLARVVTRPYERKALTERDQQVLKNAIADAARRQGAPPQAVQAFLDQMQFADHYPVVASLAAGPEGTVWAQRIRSGDELVGEEGDFDAQDLGSPEWDVFDARGRYLGVVTFPGKYQPIRVMGDRFYGIARDELDVQSLKVYRVGAPTG